MASMIGTPRSGLPCVDDYYLGLRVCVTIRHDPYPGMSTRGNPNSGLLL